MMMKEQEKRLRDSLCVDLTKIITMAKEHFEDCDVDVQLDNFCEALCNAKGLIVKKVNHSHSPEIGGYMKYYCENCDRDVDDNGPYECANGEYVCQDCMEQGEARAESLKD